MVNGFPIQVEDGRGTSLATMPRFSPRHLVLAVGSVGHLTHPKNLLRLVSHPKGPKIEKIPRQPTSHQSSMPLLGCSNKRSYHVHPLEHSPPKVIKQDKGAQTQTLGF